MKKIIFLFAMVLAVSMVMGQKTTWVDQSGFNNTANVTQSACTSMDATSIYAVQSGTWNTLNTAQKGSNNYIELYQTGANNTADLEQLTCNVNNPGPAAYSNNADIYQTGNSNAANLTQKEDDTDGWDFSMNTAHAKQSGSTNSYILKQGGLNWKPTNAQFLTQSGFNNSADIDQQGLTDYSEITQNGDWNSAYLNQYGAAMSSPAIWHKSYSWQLGANNMLDIKQDGNSFQLVESLQNGNSNQTDVWQRSWDVQQVVSKQQGSGDIINVTQIN